MTGQVTMDSLLTECVEWAGYRKPSGHGQRRVNGKTQLVHRIVFEEAYGYLPEVVRHKCDNPPCINPAHLEGGTQADNVKDMIDRGRQAIGERSGSNLLTEAQVIEILESVKAGTATQVELARRFGVSKQAVNHVVKGRSWKKITEEMTESIGH